MPNCCPNLHLLLMSRHFFGGGELPRICFYFGAMQVSHTCFFSVELPPYSSEDLMRKGLLTAIHFGMGGILNA